MLPFKIVAKLIQAKYGYNNFAAANSIVLNAFIVSKTMSQSNKISINAKKGLHNPKNKTVRKPFNSN